PHPPRRLEVPRLAPGLQRRTAADAADAAPAGPDEGAAHGLRGVRLRPAAGRRGLLCGQEPGVTLFLGAEDVVALATHEVVMDAARTAVDAERNGETVLPARLDVDLPGGFLRVMPAAFDGVMGLKVMTLVEGLGTRYLVLVYSQSSGGLEAALDADEVTRLRTAATTAVAGELLAPAGTDALAVIGSGFEAE